VSIKVDESAKKLLERVKEVNDLSNISDAIRFIASGQSKNYSRR
jgi:hypothetical protein